MPRDQRDPSQLQGVRAVAQAAQAETQVARAEQLQQIRAEAEAARSAAQSEIAKMVEAARAAREDADALKATRRMLEVRRARLYDADLQAFRALALVVAQVREPRLQASDLHVSLAPTQGIGDMHMHAFKCFAEDFPFLQAQAASLISARARPVMPELIARRNAQLRALDEKAAEDGRAPDER